MPKVELFGKEYECDNYPHTGSGSQPLPETDITCFMVSSISKTKTSISKIIEEQRKQMFRNLE